MRRRDAVNVFCALPGYRGASTICRSGTGGTPLAREQRRLAAIVAADVVGYSRLMGRDESGTVKRLRQNRAERLDPVLAKYGGRLVKLTGDGALIEFGSAVDALTAASSFSRPWSRPTATGLQILHLCSVWACTWAT